MNELCSFRNYIMNIGYTGARFTKNLKSNRNLKRISTAKMRFIKIIIL